MDHGELLYPTDSALQFGGSSPMGRETTKLPLFRCFVWTRLLDSHVLKVLRLTSVPSLFLFPDPEITLFFLVLYSDHGSCHGNQPLCSEPQKEMSARSKRWEFP